MKKWYLFYSTNKASEKLQQLVGELQSSDNKQDTKLHQLGVEIQEAENNDELGLAFPLAFSFVPWRHHIQIITKCKDIDEALFFPTILLQNIINWCKNPHFLIRN